MVRELKLGCVLEKLRTSRAGEEVISKTIRNVEQRCGNLSVAASKKGVRRQGTFLSIVSPFMVRKKGGAE